MSDDEGGGHLVDEEISLNLSDEAASSVEE